MPTANGPRPQVFISHTDAADEDARAFRTKLCKALKKKGFDPLLDEERLELGDEWRRQLLVWLLGCHAGVILLTKRALEDDGSRWMQFETTVLVMLRTRAQLASVRGAPPFPIIPVLVPPTTLRDLDGTWLAPHALTDLQGGTASAALVKDIVATLEGYQLETRIEDTPLAALKAVFTPWLESVGERVIRETGDLLGADTTTWLHDAPDQLATCLLKADLTGVETAMERLAPQMPLHARALVEILSAGWVDPEAAAKLPPIAASDRPVVGINATYGYFTGNSYVRRAWATHPAPPIAQVTDAGERDAEGAIEEVLEFVRSRMVHPESSDDLAIKLMARAGRGSAYHVFLPWVPEEDMIQELTSRLPAAAFICLSPDDSDTGGRVEYLMPKVDPAYEEDAYLSYENAKDIVARSIS